MNKIDKLWELLKQPSTHKGLIVLAGTLGVVITPEYAESIGVVAMLAYAVYQILRDEDTQIKKVK